MTTERQRNRCRERLELLGESTLDSVSLRREAIAELRHVVGFDRWCWPLADPETLLPLSGLAEHDFGPGVPRSLELEYSGDDFAAKHVLARRSHAAGTLGIETHGDLARSPRWHEVMAPVGIGDVATIVCRDTFGCWGWVEAYRDRADRPFGREELELFERVGSCLGSALRRTFAMAGNRGLDDPDAPGVLVLNEDLRLVSWTPAAQAWIDVLPSAQMFAHWGMLPSVVYPAATLARNGDVSHAHALLHTVDDVGWSSRPRPSKDGTAETSQ